MCVFCAREICLRRRGHKPKSNTPEFLPRSQSRSQNSSATFLLRDDETSLISRIASTLRQLQKRLDWYKKKFQPVYVRTTLLKFAQLLRVACAKECTWSFMEAVYCTETLLSNLCRHLPDRSQKLLTIQLFTACLFLAHSVHKKVDAEQICISFHSQSQWLKKYTSIWSKMALLHFLVTYLVQNILNIKILSS